MVNVMVSIWSNMVTEVPRVADVGIQMSVDREVNTMLTSYD